MGERRRESTGHDIAHTGDQLAHAAFDREGAAMQVGGPRSSEARLRLKGTAEHRFR
jgi:hypothetical protein